MKKRTYFSSWFSSPCLPFFPSVGIMIRTPAGADIRVTHFLVIECPLGNIADRHTRSEGINGPGSKSRTSL